MAIVAHSPPSSTRGENTGMESESRQKMRRRGETGTCGLPRRVTYGRAVQVDPGFPQLTPRLLSTLETKIREAAFKLCFRLASTAIMQPAPLQYGNTGKLIVITGTRRRAHKRGWSVRRSSRRGLTLVHFPAQPQRFSGQVLVGASYKTGHTTVTKQLRLS